MTWFIRYLLNITPTIRRSSSAVVLLLLYGLRGTSSASFILITQSSGFRGRDCATAASRVARSRGIVKSPGRTSTDHRIRSSSSLATSIVIVIPAVDRVAAVIQQSIVYALMLLLWASHALLGGKVGVGFAHVELFVEEHAEVAEFVNFAVLP